MCKTEHTKSVSSATLDDMSTQRDHDDDEREIWLRQLMEEFRAREKRALVKRGIAMWTHAEHLLGFERFAALPPNKVN